MKIKSVIFSEVGPLNDQVISLDNDWDGSVESRALLSGPNGCGKSTVLRAVAMLWDAFGYWLDKRKQLPLSHSSREWLQSWGGCAVIFENIPDTTLFLGLVFGELSWCQKIKDENPHVIWVGEGVSRTGKPGAPKKELFLPDSDLLNSWGDARKQMILSFGKAHFPNVIYLDAEERRWVKPKKNLGNPSADDPSLRWLPRYVASEDWKGQLETSLIALKTTQLQTYHAVIRKLNTFLAGKEIDSDIRPGENRLRVKIKGQRGVSHSLDELSAGEHQVLILIYLLARWAEEGCVVLIDEPDLYLHPSLVSGMLANLEQIVAEKNGQLLITSHQPEIWKRYEIGGKRIELGGVV